MQFELHPKVTCRLRTTVVDRLTCLDSSLINVKGLHSASLEAWMLYKGTHARGPRLHGNISQQDPCQESPHTPISSPPLPL